ncbi:MAG TPA: hypothetical protein VED37_17230 [Ktedonobacteraceae bacterium]|nr:hypothetical protein [Ktedonobacteraceae bacterium]
MTQIEKGTSILKLKVNVKDNKIEWFYTPVYLLAHTQIPTYKSEALDLSDLMRKTIKFYSDPDSQDTTIGFAKVKSPF